MVIKNVPILANRSWTARRYDDTAKLKNAVSVVEGLASLLRNSFDAQIEPDDAPRLCCIDARRGRRPARLMTEARLKQSVH